MAVVGGDKSAAEKPDPDGDAWVDGVLGPDGVGEDEAIDEDLCAEAVAPKTLFNPLLPSAREVADHNLTHCPYRRWW